MNIIPWTFLIIGLWCLLGGLIGLYKKYKTIDRFHLIKSTIVDWKKTRKDMIIGYIPIIQFIEPATKVVVKKDFVEEFNPIKSEVEATLWIVIINGKIKSAFTAFSEFIIIIGSTIVGALILLNLFINI